MPVAELLQRVSSAELGEWMALRIIENEHPEAEPERAAEAKLRGAFGGRGA